MYGKIKNHLQAELEQIREAGLFKEERIITKVIDEIKSQQKIHGVIYIALLEKFISDKLGADQYYNSLDLGNTNQLKSYLYALGIVKEKSSYKRSGKNQDKFDKLWKADGRIGIPKNKTSIGNVFILKTCNPVQLIQYYRNELKSGSDFVT